MVGVHHIEIVTMKEDLKTAQCTSTIPMDGDCGTQLFYNAINTCHRSTETAMKLSESEWKRFGDTQRPETNCVRSLQPTKMVSIDGKLVNKRKVNEGYGR